MYNMGDEMMKVWNKTNKKGKDGHPLGVTCIVVSWPKMYVLSCKLHPKKVVSCKLDPKDFCKL